MGQTKWVMDFKLLDAIKGLLPYLRYLPVIIAVVRTMTDAVEASADGHTSAEKQAAARVAIQSALSAFGVVLEDRLVDFFIDGIVLINNTLGVYSKKA